MGLTTNLVNPRIEIEVFSDIPFTIRDLHMDFDIQKDLTEEPNEAELTIYNLSASTRAALSNNSLQGCPVEVFLTPAGMADKNPLGGFDLVRAFRGEIDSVKSIRERPGYATVVHATSQKENHRAFAFGPKTYGAGSPQAQILADLVAAVGLTPVIDPAAIPANTILLAETLSGPAFPLLARKCEEWGLNAFINDGKVFVTSIYTPMIPTPRPIFSAWMLSTPSPTTRTDSADIEMRTVIESTTINPFASLKKKDKTRSKVVGANDYVEYQACDKTITGVDFELLAQPDMQPDDVVSVVDHLDWIGNMYRVQEVHHHGDNYGGDWTTDLVTDDIEAEL